VRTAVLVLLVICSSAHADEWKTVDYTMLGAATALLVVDWGQTRDMTRQPAYREFHEYNAILGKNPSVGDVDRYFGIAILSTVGLAYVLTPKWRRYFLGSVIAIEGFVVIHNHQIGLRAEF
jgi:hypothetical protein